MNYFELYPGDYLRDTGELSLAQHGAYLLLMASYYSTEAGLPADRVSLYRITHAMTKDEQAATDYIAARFFTLCEDGRMRSQRIEDDIYKARGRIEAARTNGTKGGRPKKAKPNPGQTQQKPNGFRLGSNPVNPDGKLNLTQEKAHQTPYTSEELCKSPAPGDGITSDPGSTGRGEGA